MGRVGPELSHLGSRWFVYDCYECTVFASEGRDFPLKSLQEELRLKNKHWVSLNDMNTGLLLASQKAHTENGQTIVSV